MNRTAPSALLLLSLLAWPAAANDDCTAHTADDARSSGEDVRGKIGQPDGSRAFDDGRGRQHRLGANLFLCANGLPGCDESLLSPEERVRFMVNQPEQP